MARPPAPGPGASPPARAGGREWAGLAVLALPTLLIGLDLTVLHLAAPEIAADLRPSDTALLWIVDVYGFVIAGLLLTMGTLGDRIGRRRLLLTGAAGFAAASVLAAFASSPGMLILARALLGIAGATLMPSTLSLIRNMFADDRQRTVAISVWMAALLSGTAIGPIVGGVVLEAFDWGAVFLLGVPVMLVLLVAGPLVLPEYRDPTAGRLDLASAGLVLATVLPLVWAVKEASAHGTVAPPAAAAVVGLVAGTTFVRRQRRLDDPMLDVGLFANRELSAAVATYAGSLLVLVGIQYLAARYLQLVLDRTPLQAGIALLPGAVLGLGGAVAAPLLVRRFRPFAVVSASLVVAAVALVPLLWLPVRSGLPVLVPVLAVVGFAATVVTSIATDRVVGAAPPERAGAASGVSETSAELGIALGIAVLGSLATAVQRATTDAPLVAGPGGAEAQQGFTHGLQAAGGVGVVVLLALAVLCGATLRSVPRLATPGGGHPRNVPAPDTTPS